MGGQVAQLMANSHALLKQRQLIHSNGSASCASSCSSSSLQQVVQRRPGESAASRDIVGDSPPAAAVQQEGLCPCPACLHHLRMALCCW